MVERAAPPVEAQSLKRPLFILCLEIEMILGLKTALIYDPPIILIAIGIIKHDYNAHRVWWSWLTTRARLATMKSD